MNKDEFMAKINEWYDEGEHEKIIEAILALPDSSLDDEILSLLAVAYNNTGEFKKAIAVLESQHDRLDGDYKWHYRMGYALMHASEDEECENDENLRFNILDRARVCFARCMNMNPPEDYLEECDMYIEEIEDIMNEGEDEEELPEDCEPELYDDEEFNTIEEHIREYFGEFPTVYHEMVSPDIHVDICCVPPTEKRDYYTLITMGMGAHIMSLPSDLPPEEYGRAELIICLPRDWKLGETDDEWYWPIGVIKSLARLPIACTTWLGWAHSIDNQEPFASNTELCGSLLINPEDIPEGADVCELPNGDKVRFYEVIPIYRSEMEFKIDHDADALISRMADVSHVVDINRPDTCEGYTAAPNIDDELLSCIDDVESHFRSISEKNLPLDKICAANHIAIFMRWAIKKHLYAYELKEHYPEIINGVLDGSITDLRPFIISELGGTLLTFYFNYEGYRFASYYYLFNSKEDSALFPCDVDSYAEKYFGTERYNSEEFQDEAYLFVPFDENYYEGLSAMIERQYQVFKQKFDREQTESNKGFAEINRGLLGCTCTCFYPRAEDVRNALAAAKIRGKEEGFVPVLFVYDSEPLNRDNPLSAYTNNPDPISPLTIAEVPVKNESDVLPWFKCWFGGSMGENVSSPTVLFEEEFGTRPAVISVYGDTPVLYLPEGDGCFSVMTADPALNESAPENALVLDKGDDADLLPAFIHFVGSSRYRLFAPMEDDRNLVAEYHKALERGKPEGFVPVIITISKELFDALATNSGCLDSTCEFGFNAEALESFRNKMLSCDLSEINAQFDALCSKIPAPTSIENEAPLTRFISYWDINTRKTFPLILAEIPVSVAWQIFAHIPFGGYDRCPALATLMAATARWNERFGALPAVIGSGTLEFFVQRPADKHSAPALAAQMYAVCPVLEHTAPLPSLAASLDGSTVWFFKF